MPLFPIERRFAGEFLPTSASTAEVLEINDEIGVRWIYSFLSADKRKNACLYAAANAEGSREAAKRAGLPTDVVLAVREVRPEMFDEAARPSAA